MSLKLSLAFFLILSCSLPTRKYFLLLILFSVCLAAQAQRYEVGDTLYVWNMDGTVVFSEAATSSFPLDTLELGNSTVVSKQDLRSVKHEIEISDVFMLHGFWVLVETNDQKGFIFDGDLSKTPSDVKIERERQSILCQRLFGKRLSYKEIERTINNDNIEYKIVDEVSTYENGSYTYSSFDGCFDHTYKFEKISLNEIYHLMMNIHSNSEEYFERRPIFQENNNGNLKFSSIEATGEIEIRIKENNTIELFYYDCT